MIIIIMILSREGSQQEGPLSSLEFCEAIDSLLKSLDSDVTLGFMDDITLSGELGTVEGDVEQSFNLHQKQASNSIKLSVRSSWRISG